MTQAGTGADAAERAGQARGYPIALASAVILSTTAILIRYLTLTYRIPPLVLAFWREMFTALLLFLILRALRPALTRIAGRDVRFLAAYGLLLAIFNSLWTLSVALAGAAVSTVLVYTSAGFTVLLGRWLLKERLDLARILAVASTLGGCVLVSGLLDATVPSQSLPGILAGVLSGLGYAAYSLMGRVASGAGSMPGRRSSTRSASRRFSSRHSICSGEGSCRERRPVRPICYGSGTLGRGGGSCSFWPPDRRLPGSASTT